MLSVQLGSALSVGLIEQIGPAGTAWLRLTAGALVFVAVVRPPLRHVRRPDVLPLVGLGLTTGFNTTVFLAAIERLPLGTAVAIEFLGPLGVAAVRSRSRAALAWPGLALVGVLLLSEPWRGTVNLPGLGFAALAAIGWALYIVLTQKVGDRFPGISGLSLTVPVAAVASAVPGVPQAVGHLTPAIVLAGFGLALLLPVLPYALELLALRHLTPTAFGTLMALEPAMGLLLGLVVLRQRPTPLQLVGIALVVVAGSLAQRGGRRLPEEPGPAVAAVPG